MSEHTVLLPQCPKCEGPMIFSMCLPYKEYVCFPCGQGVETFNSLPEIEIPAAEEERLRELYRRDAHALTELTGSGQCIKPGDCPLGMKHPLPKDYEYEFFGKGVEICKEAS